MSVSELKHVSEPVRRIEVFTGAGRRRSWSAEEKAAIVTESAEPGATVCAVARRHGLTPQQLFTWRRALRVEAEAAFVPVVVAPPPEPEPAPKPAPTRRRSRGSSRSGGLIELEIDGVVVRVGRGSDAKTVAAVIRALKAGA